MKSTFSSGQARAFERECVELFAEMVQIFGVPKSVGQIYGILYASMEPLSFSDVVIRLKASKGSVSQGLGLLRALGAVEIAKWPDDGREYFAPQLGLRRLLGAILKGKIEPVVGTGRIRMDRLRALAKASSDETCRDFQIGRIEQLETWRRRLKTVLPLLGTLLGSTKRR